MCVDSFKEFSKAFHVDSENFRRVSVTLHKCFREFRMVRYSGFERISGIFRGISETFRGLSPCLGGVKWGIRCITVGLMGF